MLFTQITRKTREPANAFEKVDQFSSTPSGRSSSHSSTFLAFFTDPDLMAAVTRHKKWRDDGETNASRFKAEEGYTARQSS